jgi:hypothetical protein
MRLRGTVSLGTINVAVKINYIRHFQRIRRTEPKHRIDQGRLLALHNLQAS